MDAKLLAEIVAFCRSAGLEVVEREGEGEAPLIRMPVSVSEHRWVKGCDLGDVRAEIEAEAKALGQKAVGDDEELLYVTITTDAVDRYGDIVDPKGADVKAYKKNPVVLFAHDSGNFPIGSGLRLKREENGWTSYVRFSKVTDLAMTVEALYKEGTMRAFSIGFLPTKYERRKDEDGKEMYSYHFQKWELLEFSAVPVPANPEALVNAYKRGMFGTAVAKQLGIFGVVKDGEEEEKPEEGVEPEQPAGEEGAEPPADGEDGGVEGEGDAADGGVEDADGDPAVEPETAVEPEEPGEEPAGEGEQVPEDKVEDAVESPLPSEILEAIQSGASLAELREKMGLPAPEEKAGKVLSKANRQKIEAAVEALKAVLAADDAKKPGESEDSDEEEDGEDKSFVDLVEEGDTAEEQEIPKSAVDKLEADVAHWKREAKKAFAERDRAKSQVKLLERVVAEALGAKVEELELEEAETVSVGVEPTPEQRTGESEESEELVELDGELEVDQLRTLLMSTLGPAVENAVEAQINRMKGRLPREK